MILEFPIKLESGEVVRKKVEIDLSQSETEMAAGIYLVMALQHYYRSCKGEYGKISLFGNLKDFKEIY